MVFYINLQKPRIQNKDSLCEGQLHRTIIRVQRERVNTGLRHKSCIMQMTKCSHIQNTTHEKCNFEWKRYRTDFCFSLPTPTACYILSSKVKD